MEDKTMQGKRLEIDKDSGRNKDWEIVGLKLERQNGKSPEASYLV